MAPRIAAVMRAMVLFSRKYGRMSYHDIANKCGTSKSSAARICLQESTKKKLVKKVTDKTPTKFTSGRGRPRKVSNRSARKLLRTLRDMQVRNFHITVKNAVEKSGLSLEMARRRTFSRYLNEEGYNYLQARKKGLLSENDRKLRLPFAREMRPKVRQNPDFWTNEVAFFLDGVSFIHKYNPQSGASCSKARVWRRKGEDLKFTSKASKNLAGGRRLHVLVAIAYGKGVILKVPYEKMSGEFFGLFIRRNFNLAFAQAGPKTNGRRLFVMDNDPSQRSKAAAKALKDIEAKLLEIPARSPDVDCIENVFNLVKRFLEEEAIALNITKECFEEFKQRVLNAFDSIPVAVIDNIILSMNKRIEAILTCKGHRTKY